MVLSYADEIFTVGEELEEALRHTGGSLPLLFKVGIADSVPKSVAYRLLEPAVSLPEPLRIVCREGKLAGLMADLAIHRLDLVIADGPMPASMSIRGFNHLLGECGLTFFAAPALAQRHRARFPRCLDGAPLLLPGEEAAVRPRLMQWIESIGVRPIIVGEFDDGALMKAFGKAGIGIFAVPSAIAEEVRLPVPRAVAGPHRCGDRPLLRDFSGAPADAPGGGRDQLQRPHGIVPQAPWRLSRGAAAAGVDHARADTKHHGQRHGRAGLRHAAAAAGARI